MTMTMAMMMTGMIVLFNIPVGCVGVHTDESNDCPDVVVTITSNRLARPAVYDVIPMTSRWGYPPCNHEHIEHSRTAGEEINPYGDERNNAVKKKVYKKFWIRLFKDNYTA